MRRDSAGNVLVEHKTSLSGTGYPLDIALSDDGREPRRFSICIHSRGKLHLECYIIISERPGKIRQIIGSWKMEYDETMMASGDFLDESTSVAVGDNLLAIYQGTQKPGRDC